MDTFVHPRGATLYLGDSCELPPGNWQGQCQARTENGDFVANLAVAVGAPVDGLTPITVRAEEAQTKVWPITKLYADLLVFDNGDPATVIISEEFCIRVRQARTVRSSS